jgi:hypothetical protein
LEISEFIKRGKPVEEGNLVEIEFVHRILNSAANIGSFTITI